MSGTRVYVDSNGALWIDRGLGMFDVLPENGGRDVEWSLPSHVVELVDPEEFDERAGEWALAQLADVKMSKTARAQVERILTGG